MRRRQLEVVLSCATSARVRSRTAACLAAWREWRGQRAARRLAAGAMEAVARRWALRVWWEGWRHAAEEALRARSTAARSCVLRQAVLRCVAAWSLSTYFRLACNDINWIMDVLHGGVPCCWCTQVGIQHVTLVGVQFVCGFSWVCRMLARYIEHRRRKAQLQAACTTVLAAWRGAAALRARKALRWQVAQDVHRLRLLHRCVVGECLL